VEKQVEVTHLALPDDPVDFPLPSRICTTAFCNDAQAWRWRSGSGSQSEGLPLTGRPPAIRAIRGLCVASCAGQSLVAASKVYLLGLECLSPICHCHQVRGVCGMRLFNTHRREWSVMVGGTMVGESSYYDTSPRCFACSSILLRLRTFQLFRLLRPKLIQDTLFRTLVGYLTSLFSSASTGYLVVPIPRLGWWQALQAPTSAALSILVGIFCQLKKCHSEVQTKVLTINTKFETSVAISCTGICRL
jgi:hypothetical protein